VLSFRFGNSSLLIIERLLSLPVVPVKCSRDAVNPIFAPSVEWQDAGEWEATGRNGHVVAWFELGPVRIESVYELPTIMSKNETNLSLPSNEAQQLARASYGTPIRNTIVSGSIMGRKLSVCGAIAVTRMTGFSG